MPKWTIPEFTTEELRELRLNPYVKSASSKIVRYTVAFKEECHSETSKIHSVKYMVLKFLRA